MTRSRRVLRSLLLLAPVTLAAFGAGVPAASAASVPFTDPAAKGYIGFCDQAGQQVSSGSVDAVPFVWKAVASEPAPAAFQGTGQNTVLDIYQPRPGVDPGDWSGDALTAASFYEDAGHPAVQATSIDLSLASIVTGFPPKQDGLYQLRMTYGRSNYGLYSATYPTAVIQVTGNTWKLVSGGTVDCHAATAVSNEVASGAIPTQVADRGQSTPAPAPSATSPGRSSANAPSSVSSTAGSAGPSSGPIAVASGSGSSPASAAPAVAAAHDSRSAGSSSSSAALPVGLGAAVVVVLSAGGYVFWRRRRSGAVAE